MRRIFIILLTMCLVFSFSVTSFAAYSTEEYEVIFKTKASYENTKYEEIFSDHRNFLDTEIFGISGISSVSVYGASYCTDFRSNQPYYILRAAIGFGSAFKAAEICAELMSCGIAEWAFAVKLNSLGSYDKLFESQSFFKERFVKLTDDTFGDLDCSKTVEAKDARTALRIAVRLEERNAYPYLMGDMDYNGEITVYDARQILRLAVGLD